MGRFLLWIPAFVAACAVLGVNLYWRAQMPLVIPPTEAPNVFSGENAYLILKNITKTIHPIPSKANLDVYHYLYDQMEILNHTANSYTSISPTSLIIETPRTKLTNLTTIAYNKSEDEDSKTLTRQEQSQLHCKKYAEYIDETQIIVRVPGVLPSSVLITAHYDSAQNSHGASDDGAGVAVILELLRAILSSKGIPKHTLIAFINNGEEVGLCGSSWLVQNQLIEKFKVRTFINLEGGGVGGRAILFRATDNNLASIYGEVVPYPRMNSIGGSLISLLGSATDYENYQRAGIPGIDIAFYERRQFYHTLRDDINHISDADVQCMGSNVLAYTQELLNTDSLDDWISDDHALYFDFFGTWGFTLTTTTRWLIVFILWIGTCSVVVVHFYFFPVNAPTLGTFVWSLVWQWGNFTSSFFLGLVVALLAILPLVLFILMTKKPLLSWTILPSSFLGYLFGVALAANRYRRRHAIFTMPQMIEWMHIATTGSTIGLFLSFFFLLNAPALYLFPIAAFTYTTLLLIVLLGSLVVQWWRGSKVGGIWHSHISYSSIPIVTSADLDTTSITTSLVTLLAIVLVVYFSVALQFAVDLFLALQSVGGYDPIIMATAPIFLAPIMYLLFPFLLSWNPQDGLFCLLAQVYLLVWAGATIQYAAS